VEEQTDKLNRELKAIYEDKITVKYIDTRTTKLAEYPLISRVIRMGYSFPIVAVNGQPRFAGAIDLEQIKELIIQIAKKE